MPCGSQNDPESIFSEYCRRSIVPDQGEGKAGKTSKHCRNLIMQRQHHPSVLVSTPCMRERLVPPREGTAGEVQVMGWHWGRQNFQDTPGKLWSGVQRKDLRKTLLLLWCERSNKTSSKMHTLTRFIYFVRVIYVLDYEFSKDVEGF